MNNRERLARGLFLGCIADDVTGATDLAINLVQGGLRVVQLMGVPTVEMLCRLQADAVVVALKTRSVPAAEAAAQSLDALQTLQAAGCRRFYFKYCSTFDSTDQGNIRPVAECLLSALESQQTVFCPAFPRAGRTVYQGYLFVEDQLLNECGMQNHPLNPMRDANLRRIVAAQAGEFDSGVEGSSDQVARPTIGLVDLATIETGSAAVREKLRQLRADDIGLVVLDCCSDRHLSVLAEAVTEHRLLTGGSGLGRYLPQAYRKAGILDRIVSVPQVPQVAGRSAVLAGSCSIATLGQIDYMRARCPYVELPVGELVHDLASTVDELLTWAAAQSAAQPLLFYSSADAGKVRVLQSQFGAARVALAIETAMGELAKRLVAEHSVRKLIVAGGETSGAVARALGVRALKIGPEICPGVPWTETDQPVELALAFKSGNFGAENFFEHALAMLQATS